MLGFLGPVDNQQVQMKEAESAQMMKTFGELVVSRSNATKLFDATEEPFDQISRGIQMFVQGRCTRRLARLGMTA